MYRDLHDVWFLGSYWLFVGSQEPSGEWVKESLVFTIEPRSYSYVICCCSEPLQSLKFLIYHSSIKAIVGKHIINDSVKQLVKHLNLCYSYGNNTKIKI